MINIFGFELRYWLRNPLPYVFGIVIGSLAFLTIYGMAVESNPSSDNQILNSPLGIYNKLKYFYLLFLLILPMIVGHSVFRDFVNRIHLLLHSFPISRKAFISGKFFSALLVCMVIAIFIQYSFAAGGALYGPDSSKLFSFRNTDYTIYFLTIIFPNILVVCSFIFWVVLHSRSLIAGFIIPILIIVFQLILYNGLNAVESSWLLAIADPLGEYALIDSTRHWTLNEQNLNPLPLSAMLIVNRLCWISISLFVSIIAFRKFDLIQIKTKANKSSKEEISGYSRKNLIKQITLPEPSLSFQFTDQLKSIWRVSNFYLGTILYNGVFITLLIAAILFIIFQQSQMTPQDGVMRFPTTASMLRLPLFIFTGFVTLLTFLYSGKLIHEPFETRMNQLVSISPHSKYFGNHWNNS